MIRCLCVPITSILLAIIIALGWTSSTMADFNAQVVADYGSYTGSMNGSAQIFNDQVTSVTSTGQILVANLANPGSNAYLAGTFAGNPTTGLSFNPYNQNYIATSTNGIFSINASNPSTPASLIGTVASGQVPLGSPFVNATAMYVAEAGSSNGIAIYTGSTNLNGFIQLGQYVPAGGLVPLPNGGLGLLANSGGSGYLLRIDPTTNTFSVLEVMPNTTVTGIAAVVGSKLLFTDYGPSPLIVSYDLYTQQLVTNTTGYGALLGGLVQWEGMAWGVGQNQDGSAELVSVSSNLVVTPWLSGFGVNDGRPSTNGSELIVNGTTGIGVVTYTPSGMIPEPPTIVLWSIAGLILASAYRKRPNSQHNLLD